MEALLIVGAGTYGALTLEIAREMGCFSEIAFVDDGKTGCYHGATIVGRVADLPILAGSYDCVSVAIGNPEVRLSLIRQLRSETDLRVATLISPRAYVSPSASIGEGCIVEPMAVIHTECEISEGCIVSAGAVINHRSVCEAGVHADCNATVPGYARVPEKTKIPCGSVFAEGNKQ